MKWNLNEVSLSFSPHKSLTYEGLFHKNKVLLNVNLNFYLHVKHYTLWHLKISLFETFDIFLNIL